MSMQEHNFLTEKGGRDVWHEAKSGSCSRIEEDPAKETPKSTNAFRVSTAWNPHPRISTSDRHPTYGEITVTSAGATAMDKKAHAVLVAISL